MYALYVKGEYAFTLSDNEATDTRQRRYITLIFLSILGCFNFWYFTDTSLKSWPGYWLSRSAVYMPLTSSINTWRLRMSVSHPWCVFFCFYHLSPDFLCVQMFVTFIILSLLLHLFQHYCWGIAKTWTPTWLNVVPDNADVFVSVGPRVFVPESNHVTQLVYHYAKLVAVFPDGYGLRAPSTTTHIWAAPVNQQSDTQRGSVDKAKI